MKKLVTILLSGLICLLGIVPALAQRWATPEEYEKATGKRIEKFYEAPEFKVLVAAGELPPVAERLPEEPLVILGFDGEIGKYGGILHAAVNSVVEYRGTAEETNLIIGERGFTGLYPNLCKSYEMRDNAREWIVKLRKGLKWSDGVEFTVDDILFAFEDIWYNEEVIIWRGEYFLPGGEKIKLEKIDKYTLRLRFAVPTNLPANVDLLERIVGYPEHYLKQFHADYADEIELNKMVKNKGFDTWFQLLLDRADQEYAYNVDKPSIQAWVLVQAPPEDPVIYKRNPYYWVVDPAGNQLPYIDERRVTVTGSQEVTDLKVLSGEVGFSMTAGINMYTLAKREEKKGKVKAFRWTDNNLSAVDLEFNLNHKDPVVKKIFQNPEFRFAVSYAINREMINEMVFAGTCEPWQVAPYETSPFYNERLAHTALEYNPEKANELFDKIGLDKLDAKGFRLRPDGKPLEITFITFAVPNMAEVAELVVDNLKAVGLNLNVRFVDWGLLGETMAANTMDGAFIWQSWGTSEGKYITGKAVRHWVPTIGGSFWANLWCKWYASGGKEGEEPLPAAQEAIEYFEKASSTFDIEEQKKWFKKVLDIAADNLWTIGTVKDPGMSVVVDSKLRNVPTTPDSWMIGDMGRRDSWFFED